MEWQKKERDHPSDPEWFIRFHGACVGCTHQKEEGIDFCFNCRNFEWSQDKRDLNNRPPSEAEIAREEVKNRRLFREIDSAECVENLLKDSSF